MSELLFECYGVPSVVYASDALSSLYQSGGSKQDGLVVSSSTASTIVIPVIAGRGLLANTRRQVLGSVTDCAYR